MPLALICWSLALSVTFQLYLITPAQAVSPSHEQAVNSYRQNLQRLRWRGLPSESHHPSSPTLPSGESSVQQPLTKPLPIDPIDPIEQTSTQQIKLDSAEQKQRPPRNSGQFQGKALLKQLFSPRLPKSEALATAADSSAKKRRDPYEILQSARDKHQGMPKGMPSPISLEGPAIAAVRRSTDQLPERLSQFKTQLQAQLQTQLREQPQQLSQQLREHLDDASAHVPLLKSAKAALAKLLYWVETVAHRGAESLSSP